MTHHKRVKQGWKAMGKIEAEFHKIPATSPDLNTIEHLFHLVKKSLENEAIANNIT
jgi:transposase